MNPKQSIIKGPYMYFLVQVGNVQYSSYGIILILTFQILVIFLFTILYIYSSFKRLCHTYVIISSPEPKAQGELIVWDSSRRLCVCPSVRPYVRPFTLSNINISETSWPIMIKFHQKHHLG